MSFAPYLSFAGNARDAMTTYADLFGATDLQMMLFSEAPEGQRPPGADSLVMHAQFTAGPGAPLMGCDVPQGFGTAGMGGSSVFHAAPSLARVRAVCRAVPRGAGDDDAFPHLLVPGLWHGDRPFRHALDDLGCTRGQLKNR